MSTESRIDKERYFLSLPPGSVRAILAIQIVGLFWLLLLLPPERSMPTIPLYLYFLLGLVLIIRAVESPTDGRVDRVAAAHYVRPVARDPAGHLQRLGPAVLATWDPTTDTFEHFAWGISAELASRTGLRPGDVDGQLERRSSFLTGLAEAGIAGANQLRTALNGFRLADSRESAG